MTGKPIEAFGRDASRLDGEATKAAVCEADAPNTSPMDKTVEVSQAARELLACPFCGSDEHLSTVSVGSLTPDMPDRPYRVICTHIDHGTVSGPVAYGKPAAIAAWNTRATQPEAALREALDIIAAGEVDVSDTAIIVGKGARTVLAQCRAALEDHRHG